MYRARNLWPYRYSHNRDASPVACHATTEYLDYLAYSPTRSCSVCYRHTPSHSSRSVNSGIQPYPPVIDRWTKARSVNGSHYSCWVPARFRPSRFVRMTLLTSRDQCDRYVVTVAPSPDGCPPVASRAVTSADLICYVFDCQSTFRTA